MSLTNSGTAALSWSFSSPPPWLSVSANPGPLIAGGPAATVTLNLTAAASQLANGGYTATLWFTNLTSGQAQNRQVAVLVGQDLVQDGGFETGDFAYWILTGLNASDNCFVDDGTTTGLTPHSGLYFAALGQTNSLAHLTQTLPTRAGQAYLLSFWLQSADIGSGTTPNQFLVNWNGRNILNRLNLSSADWTKFQFLVVADTSSTLLDFGFRDDPGYLDLDDISVVPVVAPTVRNVSAAAGQITLAWTALAGVAYQVQYATDLNSATWNNLGAPVTATSSLATAVDTIGLDSQRFYRIVLLP